MSEKENEEFFELLNSISSEISYKIMKFYFEKERGFNLTDTSRKISEKISTVKGHLKKLLEFNLIYKQGKEYFLSNFGSFAFNHLKDLHLVNKTRKIFGEIPAELIPSKFIQQLIPFLKDVEIKTDQWQFMTISNRIISQIQSDLGKEKIELKVLGWRSLHLSIRIIKDYFKRIKLDKHSLQRFLNETNLSLISDKGIIKEIQEIKEVQEILEKTDLKHRIRISENIENFNFTLFKYKNIFQLFLNEDETIGMGHFLLLENEPNAVKIFDSIFKYYKKRSTPLNELLNNELSI